MQYNFEWNPDKARRNFTKHGVTFDQATEVFKDPMALTKKNPARTKTAGLH